MSLSFFAPFSKARALSHLTLNPDSADATPHGNPQTEQQKKAQGSLPLRLFLFSHALRDGVKQFQLFFQRAGQPLYAAGHSSGVRGSHTLRQCLSPLYGGGEANRRTDRRVSFDSSTPPSRLLCFDYMGDILSVITVFQSFFVFDLPPSP